MIAEALRRAGSDHRCIPCARAEGALADAGSVPTDDVERGIRMLTARIAQLAGLLIETRHHGTATDPCWCAYRATETRPHRAWCVAARAALRGEN